MALLSIIRRWYFQEEIQIREMERRTGLSRSKIRKYLRAGTVEPKFKVPDRPSNLDHFADRLEAWLRAETSKCRKQPADAHRSCIAGLVNAALNLGHGARQKLIISPM